jgi:glycosyltransferase involved in cell wall biosynthesis
MASITRKQIDIIETPYLSNSASDNSLYEKFLKEKKYLLFFGTLGVLKGGATIANCIFDLLDQTPNLYFVFAGKDVGYRGKPMMEYIKMKAQNHHNRIIHFDKMPHEKLYPIITHAVAVVLPSRIDNLPNTCIEAMALGKIVIGTYGTSFEQLIQDGENGFLCAIDNSEDLLRTIKKVFQLTDSQKENISRKAKERIALLKPEKIVNQLITLYADTLAIKRNHP